jgi:hypothetical protein
LYTAFFCVEYMGVEASNVVCRYSSLPLPHTVVPLRSLKNPKNQATAAVSG